jgi:hypothetical protein
MSLFQFVPCNIWVNNLYSLEGMNAAVSLLTIICSLSSELLISP